MTLVVAYQSLGKSHTVVIQDGAGEAIVPGANDEIRAKIGREGATPLLTVTGTATPAGSVFTKDTSDGENLLRLDATDLAAIPAGTYTLFIEMMDNADNSEWKNVDRQVIQIIP